MSTSVLDAQFEALKAVFPGATLTRCPDGSALIIMPEVIIGHGWSKGSVTYRFVAPAGYPHAKPDCFWVDPDLKLASGGMPQNSGMSTPPATTQPLLWFSWHTATWDPNRDSLLTYARVCEQRMTKPQ